MTRATLWPHAYTVTAPGIAGATRCHPNNGKSLNAVVGIGGLPLF